MSRIFLVSFCFFSLFFSANLWAESGNNYFVENVAVSVSAKSPSESRNKAVSTARRDAFLILLTRLEKNISIANLVSNDEISEMVMSEQIDGEKIAGNAYFATFNILFAKDFVDHILAKKNIANVVPKNIANSLVIPVKKSSNVNGLSDENILWEEGNDWKMAVVKYADAKRSSLESKLIIPDADIENLSVLGKDNISSLNFSGFAPMLERYNANKIHILFFSQNQFDGKIIVEIVSLNRAQKKQSKLSFINSDGMAQNLIMDKIAARVVDYIASSQKSEAQLEASVVKLQVNFDNLEKWLNLKNKIENSGFASEMFIESLAKDHANILLKYPNSVISLSESFGKIGLNCQQKAENLFIIF